MEYDYNKLLGRIVEKYGKQSAFAKAMKMSEHSLSYKLNSRVPFKQTEITRACELLCIDLAEIYLYFFTLKVQLT